MNTTPQINPATVLEGIHHPDFKVNAVQHGKHPIIDVSLTPFDGGGVIVQANVSATLVLNTPLDVMRGQLEHWFNVGNTKQPINNSNYQI